MKKEKSYMDVVFLLDKSTSMIGTEKDTIKGYNDYLKKFKDRNAKITTILFNHKCTMVTKRKEVKKIPKLTEKEYSVSGSTALLDALGKAIKYMERKKSKKVIFIITTDGYENSSRTYTKKQIKEMIRNHREWEFIYIGADIDSYSEAMSIGIEQKNISNYIKTGRGIAKMFDSLYYACEEYDDEDQISSSWKEDLDIFVDKNINKVTED